MYTKKMIVFSLMMMAFGCYAQTVKLALVKGNKYEVSSKITVNTTANVMGQEMQNNVDNTTLQTVEVKDIRVNENDLVSITTKLLATVQMMGQEMIYDSEKKDNSGPLAETMDKMVGKKKNITVDASGKVIKEEKDDLEGTLEGMVSITGITLFQQALIGKEMKTGNTWNDSVVNNTAKMKSTTVGTYKVTAVNNDTHTATITFSGNQNSSGTIEQMGMEMNTSSSSKVESQFEVDINTGISKQITTTSNGNTTIDAMGMSIPGTTKSTTTSTIKAL